jgi:predicted ribosome quality control (RQC) complex YloA/Tae2 family protein
MKTEKIYFEKMGLDITYLIGQNAKDNFAVIDLGFEDDLWFHAETESSCHVVCLFPQETPFSKFDKGEKDLIVKKGAELCKMHTNKLSVLHNVAFIYTELKNVTKTKTPGLVVTRETKRLKC